MIHQSYITYRLDHNWQIQSHRFNMDEHVWVRCTKVCWFLLTWLIITECNDAYSMMTMWNKDLFLQKKGMPYLSITLPYLSKILAMFVWSTLPHLSKWPCHVCQKACHVWLILAMSVLAIFVLAMFGYVAFFSATHFSKNPRFSIPRV